MKNGQEEINHLSDIISSLENAKPDEEVIVCPICKSFRTVKRGYGGECLTCREIRGTK